MGQKRDISISSKIDDDSISNLVVDQMDITEIADYIDMKNVIMVDTVEKTNNKKRPLLTVGAKDSNGKMFIFFALFHAQSAKLDVSMDF